MYLIEMFNALTHFSIHLMFMSIVMFRYEQLIDHTKPLSGRTYKLVSQLLEHAQTQLAR